MILHIPHASTHIPERFLDQYVISSEELSRMNLRLCDHFTDELFQHGSSSRIVFGYSRVLVDVERFRDDNLESAASMGFGKFYSRSYDGRPLRRDLFEHETSELLRLYDSHHESFESEVARELDESGACLIVDCHSFPEVNPPWLEPATTEQPDFCIGTDEYHTPPRLASACGEAIEQLGFSVRYNDPFSGSIVPLKFYQADKRVSSVMIEVNRALYMDEATGEKSQDFDEVQASISSLLSAIDSVI